MPSVLNEQTQFTDSAGKPLVSGKAYFGVQNADPVVSPVSIFSDRELATPIANPQILDANGRTTNKVWVAGRYSLRIDDLNDVQKYQELDNGESPDVGVTALENVAGANTITATAASTITVYEDLELYAFRAAQDNTAAVTLNIDSVGAKSIVKNHDQAILPSDFEADQNIIVSYNLTDDVFEWVNQNNKVIDFYEGAPVASAATTDIWAIDGNTVHITGTDAITSFGTAPNAGAWRKAIFDDALTLTDGANLNLPGGANITTAVDDIIFVYAETTTLFKVIYFKADGKSIDSSLPAPDFTSSEQTVAVDTVLDVAHGLGAKPTLVRVTLLCTTDDIGYVASTADEVEITPSFGQDTDNYISVFSDTTNVTIIQGAQLRLLNSSNTNGAPITTTSWRYIVRAWL